MCFLYRQLEARMFAVFIKVGRLMSSVALPSEMLAALILVPSSPLRRMYTLGVFVFYPSKSFFSFFKACLLSVSFPSFCLSLSFSVFLFPNRHTRFFLFRLLPCYLRPSIIVASIRTAGTKINAARSPKSK